MSALPLWAYPLLFLGAVALSALLTPVALRFAIRHSILDHPAPSKSHAKAVPYLGGAAIVVAFATALVVGALVDPPSAGLGQLAALLGLALVLAVVGLADDVRGLPIWLRLGIELGAGVGVWAIGIVMHLAGFPGWADDLVTIGWVVVVTNAFNLLDNMDGLSAGVAAISALGIFGIAVLHGEFLVAALAIALAGCAAGFLRHNFHPARIYMGDAGSLFLGFLLAVLALKLRDSPATRVDVAALVAVLGVALLDTTLVVVSRLAHRRSPFTGGQDHTSHRLVHLGLPVRAAVGVVYATAAALAGIGVALSQAGSAVHIAGIVVLGVAGIVTLAMLALVPVYGDRLDERIRRGPPGILARFARAWLSGEGSAALAARSGHDTGPRPGRRRPSWMPSWMSRGGIGAAHAREPASCCSRSVGPDPSMAEASPEAQGFTRHWWPATLVAVAGAVGVLGAAVYNLWFFERMPGYDDLVLDNATYLFLHAGRMAFPVNPFRGSRHALFGLPPTLAFILAALMWLTHMTAEAADVLPILAWVALGSLAIVLARWSLPWKLGALGGLYAGMVLFAPQLYIRPDADMAGAWIAGLLALEAGRSRDWSPWLLGLGAFALTLASALHYVGSAAFLGVLVYLAWAWHDLGRRRGRWPIAAMLAGGLAVGVPYLTLFVVPDLHWIVADIHSLNGSFNPVDAVRQHVAYYHAAGAARQGGGFLAALARPFTWSGVPVVLVTTPFLWARRETRGIALASLPNLLFILLVNHLPPALAEIYINGEMMLYFICVLAAVLLAARAGIAWARHRARHTGALPRWGSLATGALGLALVATVVTTGQHRLSYAGVHTSNPLHDEMGLARAAAYSLVGPGAIEGGANPSLWYITGASTWYAPEPEAPLTMTPARLLNVAAYARSFTAMPEGSIGTTAGIELARGVLSLRGFYLQAGTLQSYVAYLLAEARPGQVTGFVDNLHSLYELRQAPGGTWRFSVAVCSNKAASAIASGGMGTWQAGLVTYLAPQPGPMNWGPVPGGSALVSFVATRSALASSVASGRLAGCSIRAEVSMSEHRVSRHGLIAWAHAHGDTKTIAFPRLVPAINALYTPPVPVRTVGRVALSRADFSNGVQAHKTGSSFDVTTLPAQWSEAGQVTLGLPASSARRWVELDGSVRRGIPGMCILDLRSHTCLTRRQLAANLRAPFDLPIPATRDPIALYLDNEGSSGPASLTIRNVSVVQARRAVQAR